MNCTPTSIAKSLGRPLRCITSHFGLGTTLLLMKETDKGAKTLDGKVQSVTEKTSLFVRKVAVTHSVELSFGKASSKSCAFYPQNCFITETVFGTDTKRRLTL